MKLTLSMLAEELRRRGLHTELIGHGRGRAFSGVRLLPQVGPLIPDHLYLYASLSGAPARSKPGQLEGGHGYVVLGKRADLPPGQHLALEEGTDPLTALAVISETFDRYAGWELELMSLANDGQGLPQMLAVAEDVLGNPVFAYDAALRPLAHGERLVAMLNDRGLDDAYRLSPSGDWIATDTWLHRLEKGGLLQALRENPVAFQFASFDMPFVAANLQINGHSAGFLTVPPLEAPLAKRNLAEANLVARCLSQALERVLMQMASTLEPTAVPTLDMLLANSDSQLMQLGRRGWDRHDHYTVMVIKGETNLRTVDCYQELFRRLFAGCQVIVGRTILVVVLRRRSTSQLRSELDTLSVVFRNSGLVGGVSLDFTDFLELRAYYEQAHTCADAVPPAAPGPPVVFYEDHFSEHLTSVFSRQFKPECHILPSVRALATYDADHGAALLDTLYAYLTHDRSHDTSAEQLHIHKSTLKYRLSRIRELAGDDCFSPDQRLNVLNSIKMARIAAPPSAKSGLTRDRVQTAHG
ncbi:MAG: helix-turn-helix domain-containing protein [Bifidobacteriaceae bacterium]|jgi:hypothetical protein|nr:helix-turn-helix domain-containing protein [Bifidobacteriaceae bacterium]